MVIYKGLGVRERQRQREKGRNGMRRQGVGEVENVYWQGLPRDEKVKKVSGMMSRVAAYF
jgi:hypothetical protein